MTDQIKSPNLREQYGKDERFRGYVDRICKAYKRTVEEALQLALVREAAKYYQEEAEKEAGRISANQSSYMPMGECV